MKILKILRNADNARSIVRRKTLGDGMLSEIMPFAMDDIISSVRIKLRVAF